MGGMKFFVFTTLVLILGMFHRREHVLYENELYALRRKLESGTPDENKVKEELKGRDWRLTGFDRTYALLKRAFEVPGREDLLRYAVPVVVLCVIIVYLRAWHLAAIYGVVMGLKWFVVVTALDIDPFTPRYETRLFGYRIFGLGLGVPPHEDREIKEKEKRESEHESKK